MVKAEVTCMVMGTGENFCEKDGARFAKITVGLFRTILALLRWLFVFIYLFFLFLYIFLTIDIFRLFYGRWFFCSSRFIYYMLLWRRRQMHTRFYIYIYIYIVYIYIYMCVCVCVCAHLYNSIRENISNLACKHWR